MHRLSGNDDLLQNEYYESDIRYTFQLCDWVLKLIGIYPLIYSHTSRLKRIFSVILILICCCIMQSIIIPAGYYILFHEKDSTMRIKSVGPLTFCVSTFLKYGYLGLKRSAFKRCIQQVKRDWKILKDQHHRAIMITHATMSRHLFVLCAVFLYTGGLSFHTIMPLLSKKDSENFTIRPLTYPGYEVFFDVQQSPMYEIVYCTHCLYPVVAGHITIAAYSLTAIFTIHACGQIEIQRSRLKSLGSEEKVAQKGALERCLATVVGKHVEILRFTKNVEETLRELLLMETMISTVEICLLEYYCVMEWETNDIIAILTYGILLVSFSFNVLIFCYVGELLLSQGNKISSACYETEWYNLAGRKARDIIMLIAISKYPPKLTAGKMFDLSLYTFGIVLKSSLVYLNMLRTVTEL